MLLLLSEQNFIFAKCNLIKENMNLAITSGAVKTSILFFGCFFTFLAESKPTIANQFDYYLHLLLSQKIYVNNFAKQF